MRFFLCLLCAVSIASPISAGVIAWNVTYGDAATATGFGTGHADGQTRRDTFESALNYISATFDTADVTLDYAVNASQTDGTGFLASAGTSFFVINGFTNGVMFEHANTGIDPSGGVDGSATFDFGYNWNPENDASAGGEFDLFTVALHEVTHSLGFLTLTAANGDSVFGANPGTHSVQDSFLVDDLGNPFFAAGGNFIGDAADLTGNNVFFSGANAMAANGGNAVRMYAPPAFASGSSLSHVDTATFPTAVMTHAVAPGVDKKAYSAIDLGILQDIGWTVNSSAAVPEPSTFALLGIGAIGMIGYRRRKRKQAA
jgi:hypothetical protein